MNRKILAAVGVAALSASLAFGGAVDQSMATVAAERFVSGDGVGALLLAGRTAMPAEKRGSLWIVRLAPSGYVVVQGSDKAEPVVTFSAEDWTEPEEGSPFFEMLRGASEACAALEADAAAAENPKWSALSANRPRLQDSMPAGATFMVEPFMTAHWHQKHPYSDYTPLEWPCGCKATATGQELAHWKWPWRPEFTRLVAHPLIDHSAFRVRLDGNEPFDWDNVFDSYSAADMQSRAKRHAAGRLVLWCQSLVNMHFMNGGAGAYISLYDKTPYYETGRQWIRSNADTYSAMVNALREDMVFRSPVQVSISGHAVVAHGFAAGNDVEYVYLNYGWAGMSDNWYNLRAENSVVHRIETGFRPMKTVQLEPLPAVSDGSVTLRWHVPSCHTNNIAGYKVAVQKADSAVGEFRETFDAASGRISNAAGMEVKNGALYGYPGCSSTYTFPESVVLGENAELSYDFGSFYMSYMTYALQVRFDGGEWIDLHRDVLAAGRSAFYDYGTTEKQSANLSAYAGRRMEFRFMLDYNGPTYYPGACLMIDNFTISNCRRFSSTGEERIVNGHAARSLSIEGLENGASYCFAVAPMMADGSASVPQRVGTRIGTPAPAPQIREVALPVAVFDMMEEGFYSEAWLGGENEIYVDVSESVVDLSARPSHLSVVGDGDVTAARQSATRWKVVVDTSRADQEWDGTCLILTLKATNADGTAVCKDVELRLKSRLEVHEGTLRVPMANALGSVEMPLDFANTTTLDAKGGEVFFPRGVVNGSGSLTLANGTFHFEVLDGFTGWLVVEESAVVSLPQDMTGFAGILQLNGDTTLRSAIGSAATLRIADGKKVILSGASVDAIVKGGGEMRATSGASFLESCADFSGRVYVDGGTLTIPAGGEKNVWVYSGKLRIALDEEQEAFGYTADDSTKNYGGAIVFVKPDGTEIAATATGGVYAYAASAKMWSSDGWDMYTDKWSGGMPVNGDNVMFRSLGAGSDVVTVDMNLDANVSVDAGIVKATGTRGLYFAQFMGHGSGVFTADTLMNDVTVELATPLFKVKAVQPSADIIIDNGTILACDIDYYRSGFIKKPSGGAYVSALDDPSVWQGTVVCTGVLPGVGDRNPDNWFNPNRCGNASSVVRLKGTSGYFALNTRFVVPVELVDDGAMPALDWNNGSSSSTATFAKIMGDGTFKTSNGVGREKVIINDISEFAGAFDLAFKTVAIGTTITTNQTNGILDVNNGYTATVPAGKTWRIGGGVFLDGSSAKIDVKGTLITPKIAALGVNAHLVLEDGGVIEVESFPEEKRLCADLYGGTLRINANATAKEGICFSSWGGRHTTLDVKGHALTFAAGAVSGHGEVYPTSTADAPGSVVFTDLGVFAGTIIIDGSTEVSLPVDLKQNGITIDLRAGEFVAAAGKECNVKVANGATLVMTLTEGQQVTGYTTSAVTLEEGGALAFRDEFGKVLAVRTIADRTAEGYVYEPSLKMFRRLEIASGVTATVPEGMTWKVSDGVYVNGALVVNGKVMGSVTVNPGGSVFMGSGGEIEGALTGKMTGYMEGSRVVVTNFDSAVTIPASAEEIRFRFGGADITGAFVTPEKGVSVALALDPEGVVDGVKVKPELAMDGGVSFRLEGDGAVFDVKVIAGLWYSVKYGTELSRGNVGGAAGTTGAVQAAETGVKTITAPRCGERGFYKLIVAPADD
jgi:hypothetical protein